MTRTASIGLLALLATALAAPGSASAHGVSVSIGLPGFGFYFGAPARPAYAAPPYFYYSPPVVYGPPAYYFPRRYYPAPVYVPRPGCHRGPYTHY